MKQVTILLSVFITVLASCVKMPVPNPNSENTGISFSGPQPGNSQASSKSILVDASRDGGVWWSPQSSAMGFSAEINHQGKMLVDYIKTLGFEVNELARGTVITKDLLSKYSKIIRAGAFGNYSSDEIAAYTSFLNGPNSLLLLQDHLGNSSNDNLSAQLGLPFTGSIGGTITSFTNHSVTTGVSSFPFMVGSVINNPDQSKITVIGQLSSSSAEGSAAMGILKHSTSKIFFIGDVNGIEQLPQPFTSNLVNWLFK